MDAVGATQMKFILRRIYNKINYTFMLYKQVNITCNQNTVAKLNLSISEKIERNCTLF